MKAIRPRTLSDLVIDRLRKEIIEGPIAFGEALSESKIADRYGVSRTPVREAFARLELEGLVRTEPQLGTFVFTMDRQEFVLVSEARFALESAALGLALDRARPSLAAEWQRCTAAMTAAVEAGDRKGYADSDGAFHGALFTHAGNPYLTKACHTISSKMDAVRNRLGTEPTHMAKSYNEHLALLAAVEAGQRDECRAILWRHVCEKGETFWSVPESTPKSRWERLSALAD